MTYTVKCHCAQRVPATPTLSDASGPTYVVYHCAQCGTQAIIASCAPAVSTTRN